MSARLGLRRRQLQRRLWRVRYVAEKLRWAQRWLYEDRIRRATDYLALRVWQLSFSGTPHTVTNIGEHPTVMDIGDDNEDDGSIEELLPGVIHIGDDISSDDDGGALQFDADNMFAPLTTCSECTTLRGKIVALLA